MKSQKKTGLESALNKIKELKAKEEASKDGFSAEEALKYLLYMVDVSVLYDTALGMYDFELVMFVAQKSQKDPKEYISFLNDLNKVRCFHYYIGLTYALNNNSIGDNFY